MNKLKYEDRLLLREYLQKKVTITRIAQGLNVSRSAIYDELKRGMSSEAYKMGMMSEYDPDRAQRVIEERALRRVRRWRHVREWYQTA